MTETVAIAELMESSGVKFGTSGARGLVTAMTDRVCYAYTAAFVQHLESRGELAAKSEIALAGDLRPSTARIARAVLGAIEDRGHRGVVCGAVPSPTVALYGLAKRVPAIMVTGSHIPDDRNGIKFNTAAGEIRKDDEAGIRAQRVALAARFDASGSFRDAPAPLPEADPTAARDYVRRYLDAFPQGALAGQSLGLYGHSAVGRELLHEILTGLGAKVTRLGYSDAFIPVDTEAIRPADVELARGWAAQHAFDAVVSTDGDSDRPLVGDERGEWLRGDVLGVLCARYLKADAVAAPVSCNTLLEKSGAFAKVHRTRIGSPYVIEAMNQALLAGASRVVGYEANGGFLTASAIPLEGGVLAPLPTRDAVLVILSVLSAAIERRCAISGLLRDLPSRFTASDRLAEFPSELGKRRVDALARGGAAAVEAVFGAAFGSVRSIDTVDGLRITFENGEIVHVRPSGNAPELRCYTEADSDARARAVNAEALAILRGWR